MFFLISNLDCVALANINKHSPARLISLGTDLTPLLMLSATHILAYRESLPHSGLESKHVAFLFGCFLFFSFHDFCQSENATEDE